MINTCFYTHEHTLKMCYCKFKYLLLKTCLAQMSSETKIEATLVIVCLADELISSLHTNSSNLLHFLPAKTLSFLNAHQV